MPMRPSAAAARSCADRSAVAAAPLTVVEAASVNERASVSCAWAIGAATSMTITSNAVMQWRWRGMGRGGVEQAGVEGTGAIVREYAQLGKLRVPARRHGLS